MTPSSVSHAVRLLVRLLVGVTVVTLTTLILLAQDREPPRFSAVIGVLDKPGYLPFDERLLASLRVRDGFAECLRRAGRQRAHAGCWSGRRHLSDAPAAG
jgi:hypothetical protein